MMRVESYEIDLLDSDDRFIRRIETAKRGGKVDLNVNAQIRGGGKINVVNEESINWLNTRVRIWYNNQTESKRFALGTFLPSVPEMQNRPGGREYPVELHDKTTMLADDFFEESFVAMPGFKVLDYVRYILASIGEDFSVLEDSAIEVGAIRTWDPESSKLRIINDLLDSINYFAIWTDGMGVFRSSLARRPQQRPLVRSFVKNESSIHSPIWTRTQDVSSIPNKVVVISEGTDDQPSFKGVAENTRLDSPYSYQNRGNRWIPRMERVEAETEAVCIQIAQRRLQELSSVSATLSVSHLVEALNLNDVVRFVSDDIDTLAVIEKMSFTLKPGSLCKATWREVVNVL